MVEFVRLKTLADFLRTVPIERFDLAHYVSDSNFDPLVCGTACAIGYCPFVFPDHWYYNSERSPMLRDGSRNRAYQMISDQAREFFGLSYDEVRALFMPEDYQVLNPTPNDVADRIDELLKTGSITTDF